jgi:hypothetical protein
MRRFAGHSRRLLSAAALAMSVIGVVGLLRGWGSTAAGSTPPVSTPSASPVATPIASPSPAAGSAVSTPEDPHAFFDRFTTAVHSGDQAFLADRMHPAVVARYGEAQSRACASRLVDPTEALHLVSVAGPQGYDYVSDGRSTQVSDTYVFHVDGTAAGRSGPRDYHFALVNGQFRLFVACGGAAQNG